MRPAQFNNDMMAFQLWQRDMVRVISLSCKLATAGKWRPTAATMITEEQVSRVQRWGCAGPGWAQLCHAACAAAAAAAVAAAADPAVALKARHTTIVTYTHDSMYLPALLKSQPPTPQPPTPQNPDRAGS